VSRYRRNEFAIAAVKIIASSALRHLGIGNSQHPSSIEP